MGQRMGNVERKHHELLNGLLEKEYSQKNNTVIAGPSIGLRLIHQILVRSIRGGSAAPLTNLGSSQRHGGKNIRQCLYSYAIIYIRELRMRRVEYNILKMCVFKHDILRTTAYPRSDRPSVFAGTGFFRIQPPMKNRQGKAVTPDINPIAHPIVPQPAL